MANRQWLQHTDYSQQIPKQMTGLHLATYFGVCDAVQLLISSDSPNLKDSYGRTPLSWAAIRGHEAVVKLLLETGKVDADSKDSGGQTPLPWAAFSGHEAVVKLLLHSPLTLYEIEVLKI
jgi:ankyrin repeat protein